MAFRLGATSWDKVERGAWFDAADGQRFLVARWDNQAFSDRIEMLKRPHRRKLERQEVPAKVLTDILCRAMSETLLLGWEGMAGPGGPDIPYTPEAGYQMLKESPDFRDKVADWAKDEEAFFGDASKTSVTPIDG